MVSDISNLDIRKIFGFGEKEKAKASRLLTSAVDGGYIKVMDPDTALCTMYRQVFYHANKNLKN